MHTRLWSVLFGKRDGCDAVLAAAFLKDLRTVTRSRCRLKVVHTVITSHSAAVFHGTEIKFSVILFVCWLLGFNFISGRIHAWRQRVISPSGWRRLGEAMLIVVISSCVIVLLPKAYPCSPVKNLVSHVPHKNWTCKFCWRCPLLAWLPARML